MKPKTTGLGKGLNAIFEIEELNVPKGGVHHPAESGISEIDIAQIAPNPGQPRTVFDDETLGELAQSIARLGVIQPITVQETGKGKYLIISGERRWRASQAAGLRTIPAYVRTVGDDQNLLEMALVENIQREDLGALEVALSLQRLIDECRLTQEELADRVGKKRSTVANYLRLLKLPDQVQMALTTEQITMGHARAIAALPTDRAQIAMLAKVLKNHLSVRQVENAVKTVLEPATAAKAKTQPVEGSYPEVYAQLVEHLEPIIGSKIAIKRTPAGGGRITINFASDDQITEFVKRLENQK